ncbi:DUF465 domain-containing protein [Asticcacaulis sp. BYS171W]|uniref:DUF465 domain-containing protein n=1 Tax=Asticcacaulis aquaticus TaxID=2984212 RepID=A0ABT5HQM9_9CAUL|nr:MULTISPECIES: DUF465 domain-containing protein [Asticcacaulis]ESQ79964.1 hypothetical protein AEYBE204_08945 [Asticcacaulis sp. YBE204]MDC7682376.1 DUF465 domain-containing protein [Asticcacaulis aquaticus]
MSIEARVRELDHRHQVLKDTIAKESRSPSADALYLKELKRKKLKLKDEIDKIRADMRQERVLETLQ